MLLGKRLLVLVVAVAVGLVVAAPTQASTSTALPSSVVITSPELVQVVAGEKATITGSISSGKKGEKVSVQVKGRGWRTVSTASTGAGGDFSAQVKLTKAGSYQLRAVAKNAGESAPIQLNVLGVYYLADREPDVNRPARSWSLAPRASAISMNARDYPRSWVMDSGTETEWDLQRRCSTLLATVGVSDKGRQTDRASLSFAVDQAAVTDAPVSFGSSQDLVIDVSGGLRLAVKATNLEGGPLVGLGNARVLCLPLREE